ncbi:hypothetical protein [Niabella ginsengisoli]|uniref:Methyltransferase n=1 Tax=Niabella ginsengisoli TaxID=522298 RepID=A0ABS9SJ91_9BACT|nr:hypothetical protein [Niabella ginsengisoli]MCH5598438.1 hypothetical protein [Niabella ginsengisoli]
MEVVRKPLQGTFNILRFNWHFYVFALALIICILLTAIIIPSILLYCLTIAGLIILSLTTSLITSWFIYDYSNLYTLPWLNQFQKNATDLIINIHAGFDETSHIIETKVPHCDFYIFDFYNPAKHTELSIKRARAAYPPHPDTQAINTTKIPLKNHSVDKIFILFQHMK